MEISRRQGSTLRNIPAVSVNSAYLFILRKPVMDHIRKYHVSPVRFHLAKHQRTSLPLPRNFMEFKRNQKYKEETNLIERGTLMITTMRNDNHDAVDTSEQVYQSRRYEAKQQKYHYTLSMRGRCISSVSFHSIPFRIKMSKFTSEDSFVAIVAKKGQILAYNVISRTTFTKLP